MNKSILVKKALFVLGFLFLFINISSLNGISNLFYRFIVTGLITFPFTYYLIKINPFKKIGIVLIFLFFIFATPTIIYAAINDIKTPGIINFIMYVIACVFAILALNSKNKLLLTVAYYSIFTIALYKHDDLLNMYHDYVSKKNEITNTTIPLINLHNTKGDTASIKPNGKIQIIDFWTNSCSYCIKSFPRFEEVYQHYKNDTNVVVYSVNVKRNNKDIKRANHYLAQYNFQNYFTESSTLKKLKFSTFPQYMIVSKKGTIKYFGTLNSSKSETYNNFYELIENEK
jgi:thiol-disulfide isomerase/thioredoxin